MSGFRITPSFCARFFALVFALGLGGCKAKPSSHPGPVGIAAVAPVKGKPLAIPQTAPHSQELAHVVVHNVEELLARTGKLWGPKQGSAPTPAKLREWLADLAPSPKIAQHLSLKGPSGCVIYDPIQHMGQDGWPGVCFFGYQGGPSGFVTDLKASKVKSSSSSEHLYQGTFHDKRFYVDALADMVVVSGHEAGFANAKGYIQKNILAAPAPAPSFAVNIFLEDIYKRYEVFINPMLDKIAKDANERLAALQSPILDPQKHKSDGSESAVDQIRKALAVIRETQQLRLSIDAHVDQLHLDATATMNATAPYYQELVGTQYKHTINGELISLLPKELVLLGASAGDFAAQFKQPGTVSSWRTAFRALATRLGKDPALAEKAVALGQSFANRLSDQTALGAFATQKGPGALALLVKVKPGISMQNFWQKEFETMDPQSWSEDFRQNFELQFKSKAATINGVALDALMLAASPTLVAQMQKSMGDESWSQLMSFLGGPSLVVHLGQIEDIAFAVITTHDAAESSSKVISALRGADHFVEHPEFSAVAARFVGNNVAMAVDAGPLSRWALESLNIKPSQTPPAKDSLEQNQLLTRVDGKRGSALRWTISAPVIPIMLQIAQERSDQGEAAR